jgi:hypothetical protein
MLCYERRSVGQSVLVSSTHLGLTTKYLLLSVAGLLMWGALSDERTGLPFTNAADLRQRNHSWVRVPLDSWLPQPRGPRPRIYIPQEQGGQVVPPGTGFPFRHLLRLAGLRWRYSTSPPHGFLQVKVKVTLRLEVSQSVSLGVEPQSITLWQLRPCFCGAPSLTSGRVCLLYMLLVLASVVFLGSESLGARDHILLSRIWDFPFRRLLRLAGSRWRYSTQPPHGCKGCLLLASRDIASCRTTTLKTHPFPSSGCPLLLRVRCNMLIESLLRNGYRRTHMESTTCNNCSIVACV